MNTIMIMVMMMMTMMTMNMIMAMMMITHDVVIDGDSDDYMHMSCDNCGFDGGGELNDDRAAQPVRQQGRERWR